MEQINKILKNIGLTETEISIYLTGLKYPSIGVKELEKQTGVKRTTIYHAINTLMEKGLVAKKGTTTRLVFVMTEPENIKRLINQKIEDLKQEQKSLDTVLPAFAKDLKYDESKINVLHYEGEEGIKLVVEEALYCKNKNWDIIAPLKNFFSDFDKKYADYFIETREYRDIKARSLWEKDFRRRALTEEEIETRAPKLLPQAMHGKFKSVLIIFDDKVAIISSFKEKSAILIQSQEIHDTFKAMFEGLYQMAEEYAPEKYS